MVFRHGLLKELLHIVVHVGVLTWLVMVVALKFEVIPVTESPATTLLTRTIIAAVGTLCLYAGFYLLTRGLNARYEQRCVTHGAVGRRILGLILHVLLAAVVIIIAGKSLYDGLSASSFQVTTLLMWVAAVVFGMSVLVYGISLQHIKPNTTYLRNNAVVKLYPRYWRSWFGDQVDAFPDSIRLRYECFISGRTHIVHATWHPDEQDYPHSKIMRREDFVRDAQLKLSICLRQSQQNLETLQQLAIAAGFTRLTISIDLRRDAW